MKTHGTEDDVRAVLPSLEITLSAHATDAVPQGNGNAASASGKHDLTSKTIMASEFTDLVSHGGATYVTWKPVLHLSRPRARLQRPAVYFTVHLTVSAEALISIRQYRKDFLTSLEPLPANVLEALQFDPSLGSSKIYLSETRITKVAPATDRMLDDIKPVRGASKRAFPIVPALFTKIRYSAVSDAVVASLHLETSQVVTGIVLIKNVSFDFPSANVESLNTLELPKESLAGDETVLLYKLTRIAETATAATSTVSVQIDAAVLPEEGPQTALDLHWQAQVDLSQTPAKSSYKWSRPLSVSGGQPPARPSTSFDAAQQPTFGEHGITFNFWAPSTMPPRKDFKINVQCINQSNRSRRFAMVVVQPKKMPTKSQENLDTNDNDIIANIFNAPPVERQKPPDVFDINPDVRIGPLLPGACYETELKFWAATTGVLELGFVRIVDLDTRQTVDVKDLPDVVVLDPSEE